ncbi:MAG: class II aldolase/adducin family protein [Clostridia bacterium]|nr:class II aldolase/adducin family protein [Clostridia bacterium]
MDILEAKKAVVKAGIELVKEGLIQRTWGNVSCRVNGEQFVITPSGRDYLSLTPDDVVLVNIEDCSYEGDVKPSSEKGIHANCYKLRENVNFVIHTHQTYASLVGLSGFDINEIKGDSAAVLGECVPLAAYGLPGTGKLKKGVADALKRAPEAKACLMIHHGALCVGESLEDAFKVANELEKVCKERIQARFSDVTGRAAKSFYEIADYVAKGLARGKNAAAVQNYDSIRSFAAIEMKAAGEERGVMIDLESGMPVDPAEKLPDTAILHCEIYKSRSDVNAIVHSKDEATLAVSRMGRTLKPFLDDFAQIAGFTVKSAVYEPQNALLSSKLVVKKLKHRDAVLLKDNGAVCVGADEDEANAVKLVTEKGCKAFAAASLYDQDKKSINLAESVLMRVIYKLKYSKKK